MGAFPIQSCTACADEWIEDGKGGFIVPPEDPDVIETAIRASLMDDDLVERAAELNWQIAVERLDRSFIMQKVNEFYSRVLQSSHDNGGQPLA